MKKMNKKEFTIKYLKEKLEKTTGKKVVLKEEKDSKDLPKYMGNGFAAVYRFCTEQKGNGEQLKRYWYENRKQIVSGLEKYITLSEEGFNKAIEIVKKWFDLVCEACIKNKGSREGFEKFWHDHSATVYGELEEVSEESIERLNKRKNDQNQGW